MDKKINKVHKEPKLQKKMVKMNEKKAFTEKD